MAGKGNEGMGSGTHPKRIPADMLGDLLRSILSHACGRERILLPKPPEPKDGPGESGKAVETR